jgi:uncharacterized protein YjiS (DUF1127 family)
MTTRFEMVIAEAFVDCGARERETAKLPRAIATRWTELRCAWMRWLARQRFHRSIAHLDDRLLADIGLRRDDLGFAERFARRHVARADI